MPSAYLARLAAPLRYPKFRQVWTGQLVNLLGDALNGVALALYLLPREDAAQVLGLVLGTASLGGILSLLVGGVLADTYRGSRIIILSDLVRAAGIGGILFLGPEGSAWALAGCAGVVGVGGGLYRPAYGALLLSLVPKEVLPAANAVESLTSRSAAILGAAAGGLLVAATSPTTALLIDLMTFVVSIVTLLGVQDPPPERSGEGASSILADARAGLAHVLQRPWIAAVMVQGTAQFALVIGPVTLLLPLLVGGEGEPWYGMVVAAEATGALIGAGLGGAIQPARPGRTAMLALFSQLPQTMALALGAPIWTIALASAVAGAGLSVFGVIWISTLQSKVPREFLGRVLSLDLLANQGLMPVGLSVSGWLLPIVGTSTLAWIASGLLVVTIVAALPVPGILDFADPPAASTTQSG